MTERASLDTKIGPALIVGLGNAGAEYNTHRHNVGFLIIDALARAHGLTFSRRKAMRAHMAKGQICEKPVVLAKPQTFMNLSGRAVGRLNRAYDVSLEQILVVYDDLDLPLGRLRFRPQGGSGGHKGMRSIIDSLGTQDFPRLRVGIDRPPGRMDPADYVLQPFDADQRALLPRVVEASVAAIECWLTTDIATVMDRFNGPVPQEAPCQENGK